MDRVRSYAEREAIGVVVRKLPPAIRRRLDGVQVVSEIPPGYLGLHDFRSTNDGHSYDRTSHVAWEMHQPLAASDRRTTIVLLDGDAFDPLVVLHELGHALDERLGFASFNPSTGGARLPMRPLNSYAAQNPSEAFATAFQSWATRDPTQRFGFHDHEELRATDPALAALFDRIAED